MNTFLDMENTFLSIYKEALLKYPDENDEKDYFGDEIGVDGFLEESPEILDREVYIIEQIQMLPENEYNDFVSLLALFYYSLFTHKVTDKETVSIFNIESDDYNEIVNDMINQTRKEFLEQVKELNCDYLMDMVEIFIAEEIENLLTEEIERGSIEDIGNCNWEIIIDSLQLDFSKEVFEKFHPNLEEESKEYERHKKNQYYSKKLEEAPVSSIKEFFQLFFFAKAKLNSKEQLQSFLNSFLCQLQDKNNEMYQKIILTILKYYYVEKCIKNEEEVDDLAFEMATYIEELDYNFYQLEDIIKEFSSFDFMKFSAALTKLSPIQSLIFNKVLTLENKKMYGNEGSWRLIDLEVEYDEIKDTFLRYCPSWIYSLDDSIRKGNKQIYIYYSENKKKEYTIPRLCLYVDSTSKIENIEGRFDGYKIEYEMLDVLKEKIKEFSYPKRISDDINYLTIMANINKKLDQKEELSLNEIEFLYEINEKVDSHYLLRRRYLEEKTDKKKDLARYYGCKAEEVVTETSELDENTVVFADSLHIYEEECNYPNLKIIMGNLFAECLKSAEGLSSLEEVKGFMQVENLESSKGLENLIHVRESSDFSSMKNTDYLNPDLIVDGSIKLPDKKTQKQLQKKFDTVKNNNNSKEEA